MATWALEIIPQNVEGKTAYIIGKRTDDTDPQNIVISGPFTVSGHLSTLTKRKALMDELDAKYTASKTKDDAKAAFLENLVSEGENYLNNTVEPL